MTASVARRERIEALASQKERQLSEARKDRKVVDEKLQAMLNRINFLQSEECKLDRDIDAAKKRALEALSRKAEKAEKSKDNDVLTTTKDILGSLGPAVSISKPPRPTTGAYDIVCFNSESHAAMLDPLDSTTQDMTN